MEVGLLLHTYAGSAATAFLARSFYKSGMASAGHGVLTCRTGKNLFPLPEREAKFGLAIILFIFIAAAWYFEFFLLLEL